MSEDIMLRQSAKYVELACQNGDSHTVRLLLRAIREEIVYENEYGNEEMLGEHYLQFVDLISAAMVASITHQNIITLQEIFRVARTFRQDVEREYADEYVQEQGWAFADLCMFRHTVRGYGRSCFSMACLSGHLKIARWMYRQTLAIPTCVLRSGWNAATQAKHAHIVAWIRGLVGNEKFSLPSRDYSTTVFVRHVRMLAFLKAYSRLFRMRFWAPGYAPREHEEHEEHGDSLKRLRLSAQCS